MSSYVFLISFYDRDADLDRELTATVYTNDKGATTHLSMFNLKTKKMFLKKLEVSSLRNTTEGLSLKDFYLGAFVTILGRQYKVVKYCNATTREKLEASRSDASALIGPIADFG